MKTNPAVDQFLKKAKSWKEEIAELRAILLQTGLNEELKWRLPCYTVNDKNIVIIQPFKACLGLMFFKGALLKDPRKILTENGPNSQSSRRLEMRSVAEVKKLGAAIKAYVKEAVKAEESGKKVEVKRRPQSVPEELKQVFLKKPKLKSAFEGLTPGRQRAYLLHFSAAKQSATRISRIEKCTPRILAGKGLTDR